MDAEKKEEKIFDVKILEIRKGMLILDGLDQFSGSGTEGGLVAVDGDGGSVSPDVYPWRLKDKKGDDGGTVYRGRRFRFEIPLKGDELKLNFYVKAADGSAEKAKLRFGTFGKLNSKNKASYYSRDGFIVRKMGGSGLRVRRAGKGATLKAELALCRSLFKEGRGRIAMFRLLACCNILLKKKPVWLIRDNEHRAKDSGAEMFRYYSEAGLKNKVRAYFILDRNSEDYPKVSKYGKIVQPYGFRYKLLHLICDTLIDTRGDLNAKYVFGDDYRYFADMCDWDYIWIIHGVMARNFASWFNRFKFNARLVITTNKREYRAVIDDFSGYGYFENEVVLTGLPRHDAMYDKKEKMILFLPTWRRDIAGRIIPGTDEREYVKNFRETDFARFYNSLINDKRLLEAMRKYGYAGDFYLHPSFIKQAEDIDGNDLIHIGDKPADANQLICRCSVLVTDYSSAQFEAAYMDRPVVYTQFDADTYNERHTGDNGYFSWTDDGFGPVCLNEERAVDAIIAYMENGCTNTEPYRSRAESFFTYRDHDNSKRVCEEIMKL